MAGTPWTALLSCFAEGPVALRLFRIFGRRDLDCGEVRDLSSDYLDDEVDGSVRGKIAAHLGQCGLCMAFIETMRATISLLGSLERQQARPSLRGNVRDRIRRETGT